MTKVLKLKNLPSLSHWPRPHLQGGQKTWQTHRSAASWSPEVFSLSSFIHLVRIFVCSFSSLISIGFWNICLWSFFPLPVRMQVLVSLVFVNVHLFKSNIFCLSMSFIIIFKVCLYCQHSPFFVKCIFLVGDICKFSKLCNSKIFSTYIVCLLVGYN